MLVEANTYNYKLPPGKAIEVNTPLMLLQLRILRKLAETSNLLTDSEKTQINALESMLLELLEGGYVESPRKQIDF